VLLGLAVAPGCGSPEQVVLGYGPSTSGAVDAGAEGGVNYGVSVVGFELVDITTGLDMRQLADGDTIDLKGGTGGGPVTLRALVAPTNPGSVEFDVDGNYARTEESAPYAIAGNDPNSGKYFIWNIPAGTHVIKATPWSARHRSGAQGTSLQQTFRIL
jgi:hypothetical protein